MPGPSPKLTNAAVFAAPAIFVVLWASGFIGAKYGLPYAPPLTFLTVRMSGVVLVIGLVILLTRPAWPSRDAVLHSAVTGLLVHGCYLGGVFVAINHGLPAGFAALVVSLQPILASTLASRFFGERVVLRQWLGLALGVLGVYLVVHSHTDGEAPLFAWLSATFALIGMTHWHALSEAVRRRHRVARGLSLPVCGGGRGVCDRGAADRDRSGAMDPAVPARARLAGVRPVARRDLASVFPDPPSGRGARC